MKTSIFLEYGDKAVEDAAVFAKARKAWKKAGNKIADLKSMDMYVKPEENKVYFVGNAAYKNACPGDFDLED